MPKQERLTIRTLERQRDGLLKELGKATERRDFSECAFIIYQRDVITDRILAIKVR